MTGTKSIRSVCVWKKLDISCGWVFLTGAGSNSSVDISHG